MSEGEFFFDFYLRGGILVVRYRLPRRMTISESEKFRDLVEQRTGIRFPITDYDYLQRRWPYLNFDVFADYEYFSGDRPVDDYSLINEMKVVMASKMIREELGKFFGVRVMSRDSWENVLRFPEELLIARDREGREYILSVQKVCLREVLDYVINDALRSLEEAFQIELRKRLREASKSRMVPIYMIDVDAGFRSYLRDGYACLALEGKFVPRVVIKGGISYMLVSEEWERKLRKKGTIEVWDVYGRPTIYFYGFRHPNVDDSARVCLGDMVVPVFEPEKHGIDVKDFMWRVKELLETPNLDSCYDTRWGGYDLRELIAEEEIYVSKGLTEGVIV